MAAMRRSHRKEQNPDRAGRYSQHGNGHNEGPVVPRHGRERDLKSSHYLDLGQEPQFPDLLGRH